MSRYITMVGMHALHRCACDASIECDPSLGKVVPVRQMVAMQDQRPCILDGCAMQQPMHRGPSACVRHRCAVERHGVRSHTPTSNRRDPERPWRSARWAPPTRERTSAEVGERAPRHRGGSRTLRAAARGAVQRPKCLSPQAVAAVRPTEAPPQRGPRRAATQRLRPQARQRWRALVVTQP